MKTEAGTGTEGVETRGQGGRYGGEGGTDDAERREGVRRTMEQRRLAEMGQGWAGREPVRWSDNGGGQ